MNKKGFTLIEIIICIALIIIIGTVSIILIPKHSKETDIDSNIKNAYNVYLENDDYLKAVLKQENEVYISFNELINNGLIDKENYNNYTDKCYKLYYRDNKNYIDIEEYPDTNQCSIKVALKDKPELNLDLIEEWNSAHKCYKSLKLKTSIKSNDNTIEYLKIQYKENGREQEKNVSISSLTESGEDLVYIFNIGTKYSDLKVLLKTDYNDEIIEKIPENFPTNIIIDKYNSNLDIIRLNNNLIEKTTNSNEITEIKSGGIISSLANINNNINSSQNIEIKDECGHTYDYSYKISNTYTYNRNNVFEKLTVNNWDTNRYYDYMFSDGSLLYTFSQSCHYCDSYSYKHIIYNPLTNNEIIINDGYDYYNSYRDISGDYEIKVVKNSDTKYTIFIYKEYKYDDGEYYTYYEKYEYDISNATVTPIHIANRYAGGSVVYSSRKHYCSLSHQIEYEYPIKKKTPKKTKNNKNATPSSSSKNSFCVTVNSSQNIYEDYDAANDLYYSYIQEYNKISNNTSNTEYNKTINTDDTELSNIIGVNTRGKIDYSNIQSYLRSKTRNDEFYTSGSMSGILKDQIWENEDKIVISYKCKNEKNGVGFDACFLTLNKSKNRTFTKTSSS